MLSIPARLLDLPSVSVLYQDEEVLFLKKELDTAARDRHSFISRTVISWIARGEQRVHTYDGESLPLSEGQLALYRKGIYTINDLVSTTKGFRSYLLFLSDRQVREAKSGFLLRGSRPEKLHPIFQMPCPELLQSFFIQLESQLGLLQGEKSDWMRLKVRELFLLMQQLPEAPALYSFLHSLDQKKNRSIRRLMEEHFDKPLSILDYAYLTGRSESTFRREFKQRFGLPPGQWLIRKRLEKAQQLLQDRGYPISSVALEVGYENVSHFIQTFKSHFDQTPAEYQQSVSG